MVTARSAAVPSGVGAVADSLPGVGSAVVDVTVAVSLMLAAVAPGSTVTTSVNTDDPTARLGIVQFTVPVAPTAGVVQLQPPGEVSEVKVVSVGTGLLSDTVAAALGPALFTVIV